MQPIKDSNDAEDPKVPIDVTEGDLKEGKKE